MELIQQFIISMTLNFLLLVLMLPVIKELGFKIKCILFKRGVIIRFVDSNRQIYEYYVTKKIGTTVKMGGKQYFLNAKQSYFRKRIPVYTYVVDNSAPHDYIESENKEGIVKLNAQIFRDTIIMAETSGGDVLKKLFQYRYVFLLVMGIAIGVAILIVLVF
ncbi:unnamed protein product, partial [marine sediment metagenome]